MLPPVVLTRKLAVEMLTEMGQPTHVAAADIETVSWHVNCSGHTVFLPNGKTAFLRHRDNGRPARFEIST
jgi:hypothetical protein